MAKLIIGCGYLGRRIARRWLDAGCEVFGVIRDEDRRRVIAEEGIRPILADVTRPETLRGLPPAETAVYCVGFDPAGGKTRREVYAEGLRHVLAALSDVRRVILISSTGVYGDAAGQWVDEDSPCRPTRDAGRALLAAEELLMAHPLGRSSVILRLAGLYGPGRLPRTDELRAGRPVAIPPGEFVNLIHVVDAAAAVMAAECCKSPRIYVVSDGRPVDRREYLACLAEKLGLPPPDFCDAAPAAGMERRSSGVKRVSNRRMLEELGVELTYPSYREGLAASVGG
jgi:nucleoside-diphosphate-sugar epimerase